MSKPAPIPTSTNAQKSDAWLALLAAVLLSAARNQDEQETNATAAMVKPPATGLKR